MKKLIHTFEISDEALALLNDLESKGYAEYRDHEYETTEDFLQSNDYIENGGIRKLEWFNERNHNGTYKYAMELYSFGLVEDVKDSWHTTFQISELGKVVLSQNK
jgi:predicted transcriptional regulator